MAKTKNKNKRSSDRKTRNKPTKTLNPFEVHINNEKIKVLNRKLKNDRGLPGVSRSKAINKRKKTLLQEYQIQSKSNVFKDKRIGERNRDMNVEDKLMVRFAALRAKRHKKQSIFNLADDEVLTHRGQTLSEIEKFDDPRSDEESDQEDTGKLDKSFVQDAHFGGGVLKKTGKEGAKSHKDLIDELIAESKKRKAEKQKTKEHTLELTDKLDKEWKDLMPLVHKSKSNKNGDVDSQLDDYDKMMRELKFEQRGTVSDKLKTEEEIAKLEKERLEELENARIERMHADFSGNAKKVSHRSADDLDDDLIYEFEDDQMVSYNEDGESNVVINADINGKPLGDENASEEEIDASADDGDDDEQSDSEESANEEDDLVDLKGGDSNSDSEENVELESNVGEKNRSVESEKAKCNGNIGDIHVNREEKQIEDDLPSTFSLPTSYEDLEKALQDCTNSQRAIIVERMIKSNHSSLAEGNKENLTKLFAYLLQYLNDIACEVFDVKSIKSCFELFALFAPHIYELVHLNHVRSHNSFVEIIKEKFEDYRKRPKEYPSLETLIFFKLVSLLFSTSDFRHQIVTPSFLFMEQILTRCKILNKSNISYGLFVSTLVLEFTALSKRILPAVVNYLGGILHMAVPKHPIRLIRVLLPFKSTNSDLVLLKKSTISNTLLKMKCEDLVDLNMDEDFKVRALHTAIKLLDEFSDYCIDLPSNVEIFESVLKYLLLIPHELYPNQVQNEIKSLVEKLEAWTTNRKLVYLKPEAQKPKPLRLYEPKIIEIFDGKRHKVQSKEKAERDKLLHKLKREKKGALREIRRDNSFLGRVKIKQQIQSDIIRKEKVKRIFAEANVQQSELNAYDRQKKRKK